MKKTARKRSSPIKELRPLPHQQLSSKLHLGWGSTKKAYVFDSSPCSACSLNLRWTSIVSLFNSSSGFKGKVYGGNDGSTNTFEVYFRFQNGQITGFLSQEEFGKLKEDAEPESRTTRNFLPKNERLQSYKLDSGETIGTSFFTLHNPHPLPCAYRSLVERLQSQLALLGITSETIEDSHD